MANYFAFSGIDDATEKTKGFLWPFKWSVWWRIAVISLFTGGLGGLNFPYSSNNYTNPIDSSQLATGFSELAGIILWLILAFILVAIVFTFLSSVFQFVFVRCLSENKFMLRKNFAENIGNGLRLFGFWIVMIIAAIIAALVFFVLILSAGGLFHAPNILLIIPAIILFLLVLLIIGIIGLFTTDFVVPVMLKDNCGIIEGWKKCWGILRNSPSQSIVYLVMRIIISIVLAIILLVFVIVVVLAIGLPFLALIHLSGLGLAFSPLHITLLAIILIIAIPILLIISVPFNTFLRVYSLSVLGKMNPEYKMIE
jgi:hypothetical protein